MNSGYNTDSDRVFSLDEFKQFDRLSQNTNNRIPIFFCIDVSGSMSQRVGVFSFETRLSLLTKVMTKLLNTMKKHPVLSERAVVGVVTYNYQAILQQSALDIGVLDINNATRFDANGQTVISLGLRRTLQAIDQYRDGVRRSDVDTFTPILVFMTDGEPVGDTEADIESVYGEIWRRIQNHDLYVFPIGISKQANMAYVRMLTPEKRGYQMINEDDYDTVFSEIEEIVNDRPPDSYEEAEILTRKASTREDTINTGGGTSVSTEELMEEFDSMLSKH